VLPSTKNILSMKKALLPIIFAVCVSGVSYAQRERGIRLNKPNIPANQKDSKAKDKNFNKEKKEDDEFTFEEEPKLRFVNEFETPKAVEALPALKMEPVKELNTTVHEDTATIDEGQVQIVEIEDEAQFQGSEDMVKIASYFSVWDTDTVDPYGIDAKEYDDVVPIQLYDISQGRYWAGPLSKGVTNSPFGWRWKRWHTGQDLDLETGDPVYAAFDGIIRLARVQGAYGRCVVIRHYNGLETLYGHLSKINFEPNTIVKAGDEIGKGGSTGRSSGPHLHFETRYEGNPFDPRNIFNFSPSQINIVSQEFLMTSRVYDYLRGGAAKGDFEFEEPVKIVRKVWIRVPSGGTLTEIAEKNNTTITEICKLNHIKPYTRLRAGYRLRIK
jgi:murein DD-endopeptidase MepM/ murein hydrolase activator NlpD